jgi:hypothetical protein
MPLYTFIHNLLNVLVQIAIKWDYKKIYILNVTLFQPMLGGVPVPTAWGVLGLRKEERPPAMEVSSRGQLTRGGPPAWGLGVGFPTSHRKKTVTNNLHKPRTWTDSLDKRIIK